MKLIKWTAVSLVVFGFSSVNAAERPDPKTESTESGPVLLQYRFSQGDAWHYSLTEKGTQTAISAGLTQSAKNNSLQTKHYRIVQVEQDGSAIVEVIVDRFRIDFTAKVGDADPTRLTYDTADGTPPPKGLEGVQKSVGKPFARFHMTPAGEITDLEFPQTTQQQAMQQTEHRKGLPIAFPDEPIQLGDSWSDSVSITLQVDPQNPLKKQGFKIQTVYQLKSVEDGIAEIGLSTIIQPRLPNPFLRGKMMSYLPRGTIRFDTKRGLIISRTETIDRRELGVAGAKTAMIVENRKEEALIDPESQGLAN